MIIVLLRQAISKRDAGSKRFLGIAWCQRVGLIRDDCKFVKGIPPLFPRQLKIAYRLRNEDAMIEITMTETAKIELLKVLKNVTTKSIRLIQQGFG
jgi:hypothetical protein